MTVEIAFWRMEEWFFTRSEKLAW